MNYIVKFVKLRRLKLAGHLARINEDRCCKKIFLAKPMRNRHPLRWIDCVEKDLNILKVKNRKTVAKSRDALRKLLNKKPRPTQGCREKEFLSLR
ncbi:hypothetical protein TNCV_3457441 [Trichonephila clavipes]|nr:hypothetical protein TNCV_3457441 [Trichonephila clavipes]